MRSLALALGCLAFVQLAGAHDVWLETSAPLARVGDRVEIDLKLGNHGNNHRDFKLASKLPPEATALEVISPAGKRYDLKSDLVDVGYTPKEGYWSAPFVTAESGYHLALSTGDGVVNHGKPIRSVRSAKAYWLADKSLDKPATHDNTFAKPLGLPFELVLVSDPVLFAAPGKVIAVKLLKQGKPVADEVVSFIPRGVELATGFDATYERKTDAEGDASFIPKEGGLYLVAAHQSADDEQGKDYQGTKYSATLTLRIPQICACCGE